MIDRVFIERLVKDAQGDEGMFASAFREYVPQLLKLVDEQTDALVMVEWFGEVGGGQQCCVTCGAHDVYPDPSHRPHCTVDAALIRAGLLDQTSRNARRLQLSKKVK